MKLKKKLLSALLAGAMTLSLMPGALAADVPNDLWVNGVQVTAQNAADVLGDGTVSYADGVLTLKGANITKGDSIFGGGIYSNEAITIQLAPGTANKINGLENDLDYGIYVRNGLTIQGKGTLDITVPAGEYKYGIESHTGLTIQDTTLTAAISGYFEADQGSNGELSAAISAWQYITINNSTVDVSTDAFYSAGIRTGYNMDITGSTVTAVVDAFNSTGIKAGLDLTVTDSAITAEANSSLCIGLATDKGDLTIDNSSITASTGYVLADACLSSGMDLIVTDSTLDLTLNDYDPGFMIFSNAMYAYRDMAVKDSVLDIHTEAPADRYNLYLEAGSATFDQSWLLNYCLNAGKQAAFTNCVSIVDNTGSTQGSLTLNHDANVPAGATLTIPAGATLTVPKDVTLTNNGIINVAQGGTLAVQGKLVDNGVVNGTVTQVPVEQPSSWAAEQVNAAIAAGIVPASLQSKYTQTATRAEFCALAVAMYETVTGSEITDRLSFADTSDPNVEKMAALGVVNGTGGNNFSPNDPLNREQAATILARLSGALGKPISAAAPTFNDNASISSWAFDSVGQVQAAKIMEGTGGNNFSPAVGYSREQCIITMMRLYNQVK